jgi:D-alanyl-D-alanine carboxypeptidase/D-alanyl-D-alanine-endopeptidase (penicillin-binding protein 4)
MWVWLASVVLLAAGVAAAQGTSGEELRRRVVAIVSEPEVSRAHWGVMVAGMDGAPIVSVNEGQFFQPASNLKLLTTAAAMALLGPERTFATTVVGRGVFSGAAGAVTLRGDLVLVGGGDANLSGRELPYVAPVNRAQRAGAVPTQPVEPDPLRYLEAMADEVAATGLRSVSGDVVGDDTLFPFEPYPQDWSIDDAVWGYGAPVSALSVGDNQLQLTITPAATGQPASVVLRQAVPYYSVEANVMTAPAKSAVGGVQVERAPGSRALRVYGQIAADAGPDVEEVAIQDPAEYAAMALRAMLVRRGIRVEGGVRVLHRPVKEARGFLAVSKEPLPTTVAEVGWAKDAGGACAGCAPDEGSEQRVLSVRRSPTLAEDVVVTNKVSENLHAEMLLHELGLTHGLDGSGAAGARVVRDFLVSRVGIDAEDVVLYDGSGLSGHDLLTPRATVRLLTWASAQPWFAAWRASLPVGGEDGTLLTRFAKGPLKGKVMAKTGTLGEARALSGYVECASGRTVAFSVMVTGHAPGGRADQEAMDRIVGEIAAAE